MSTAEDSEVIGQAIYTWSTTRLDRTSGMGFSAISPCLEASIDWLSKLQPQEFKLFRGEVTGQADLYAARQGFSEVGRLVHRDRAIIFCKTADGTLDAMKRPQLVVHGLIGRAATLGLSCVLTINGNFWRRKLDGPDGRIELDDLAMPEILVDEVPIAGHACPGDHQVAGDILALVANQDMESTGTIDLPAGDVAPAIVFLAFPADIAEHFSLDPYATVEGVRRELGLTVPARQGETAAAASDSCRFQRAVEESAVRFLRGGKPQLSKYAQAVLEAGRTPTRPRRPAPRPSPVDTGYGADLLGPVYQVLHEVQPRGGSLTQVASGRMVDRLRSAQVTAWSVLNMPTADLTSIFACVEDESAIVKRGKYFSAVPARRFAELWNSTHVSAFLGLVLVKDPGPGADGEEFKLAAERGVKPELTASILRGMRQRNGGGLSIAHAIVRGLGASDSMRIFIAESFQDDPAFLFGAILKDAEIPENHVMDYIRACYEPWAAYRQLPENESRAIANEIQRLTLLQKLNRIIRPVGGSGGS